MDRVTADIGVKCRLAGHSDYKAVMAIDENIYGGKDYLLELYHDFLHRNDTLMGVVELNETIVSDMNMQSCTYSYLKNCSAKSILRESELCLSPPLKFRGYPPRSYLSGDHLRASYFFEKRATCHD